ncbi:MAG: hypothetical protein JO313_05960 [Verrucomicrobia bacterium]|nr:hypothetical protein [Verrucomicrobiota bacterium]
MAEAIRVKISRSDLLGQSVFVLVHFYGEVPDQGRKTLQSRVMELAQKAADPAIQYLLKHSGLLKPAGEKTTAAQREVERGHEDWTDNVKAHAKDHELAIPPKNPLGLSTDILGLDDKEFITRGLTMEFKNNLEGLIEDIENQQKKAFAHIHICVCWGMLSAKQQSYACDPITEASLHERHYPGVTHILRKDGESHVIQVIMLEDIVKRMKAGQVALK